MKHGRGRREIVDLYGAAAALRIAKRLASGRAFSVFLVDGEIALADFPSLRSSGLMADCGHGFVATYTDTPSWSDVVGDIHATRDALRQAEDQAEAINRQAVARFSEAFEDLSA